MARLEELMPVWDHHEVHRRRIPAPPERVWDAMWDLRVAELPLTGALTRLRGGPGAWRRDPVAEHGHLRVMDAMAPKLIVAERPAEMVLVDVARYAALRPTRPRAAADWTAEDFAAYAEPGWSKVAMDFRLVAREGGAGVGPATRSSAEPSAGSSAEPSAGITTELITETRVLSTDPATRRSFAAYWLAVRAGSGLVRRDILHAVGRAVS